MKIVWDNSLQLLSYTKDILVLKIGSTLACAKPVMNTKATIDNTSVFFIFPASDKMQCFFLSKTAYYSTIFLLRQASENWQHYTPASIINKIPLRAGLKTSSFLH